MLARGAGGDDGVEGGGGGGGEAVPDGADGRRDRPRPQPRLALRRKKPLVPAFEHQQQRAFSVLLELPGNLTEENAHHMGSKPS